MNTITHYYILKTNADFAFIDNTHYVLRDIHRQRRTGGGGGAGDYFGEPFDGYSGVLCVVVCESAGEGVWYNPFNRQPVYISFRNTRVVVFWTKNPASLMPYLPE